MSGKGARDAAETLPFCGNAPAGALPELACGAVRGPVGGSKRMTYSVQRYSRLACVLERAQSLQPSFWGLSGRSLSWGVPAAASYAEYALPKALKGIVVARRAPRGVSLVRSRVAFETV